ncbi:unnamed protein product [Pleuronectes platessa]|uniref:Uncharacterized protein n=1 Tax=Pleuronectes platessa TaxID=8262 RepID=A0A9N7ZD86_PLEPL|nr:unnamed protein product [Pleuronectes platessa]
MVIGICGKTAGHVPRLEEQSPSSTPTEARCAVRLDVFCPRPRRPGVAGARAFFLLDRVAVFISGAEGTGYGGRRQRLWTRVRAFSRITSATAPAGGTLHSRQS